jgi:hypothetical protein
MLTMNPPQFRPIVPLPPAPVLVPYAWPTVFWRTNSRHRPSFKHLATRVTNHRTRNEPCSGHTIWRGLSQDGDAGLAWDWIEIASGVVAMVDPMSVSTNMRLLNVHGEVLPATEAALHFNQFVRRLPWQEAVSRLLQTQ